MLSKKRNASGIRHLSSARSKWLPFLLFGALLLALPAIGYTIFNADKTLLLGAVFGVLIVVLSITKPESATLAVVFVFYTNLAVVAKTLHGVPGVVAGSFSLLLCLPLANYLFIRRQKIIIDYPFLLMILFLALATASTLLMSIDIDRSLAWILEYLLEGVALYFLFVNVIRNLTIFKKVVWMLLFVGTLLGSMSLYQELFSDYKSTFWGLAQRSKEIEFEDEFYGDVYGQGGIIKSREKVGGKNRSGGPIGKPNRYAQIMVVLLPLALFRFWGERKKFLKYFALFSTLIILGGVLLTYSRGTFLTMVMLFFLLALFKYIRPGQIVATVLVVILMMIVAAPGYFARVDTLRGIEGLFSKSAEVRPDGTTRGRLTEMLAAFMAFLDYPVLGVGPAQYTEFYSNEYQSDPDIAFRFLGRNRRAHTLYFEFMAEFGLLGFGVFMSIIFLMMYRLWHIRRASVKLKPDMAYLAMSLWFAILAYLGTAIFLHLSYQRYLWFLLAISGAFVHIYREMAAETEQKEEQTTPKVRTVESVPFNSTPLQTP
ncbi:MAG: O-antigen ligase family protein [bacterium]